MLVVELRNKCLNCEFLRVDNFCLVKGKYILTKNIRKDRNCQQFSCKNFDPERDLRLRKDKNSVYLKAMFIELQSNQSE